MKKGKVRGLLVILMAFIVLANGVLLASASENENATPSGTEPSSATEPLVDSGQSQETDDDGGAQLQDTPVPANGPGAGTFSLLTESDLKALEAMLLLGPSTSDTLYTGATGEGLITSQNKLAGLDPTLYVGVEMTLSSNVPDYIEFLQEDGTWGPDLTIKLGDFTLSTTQFTTYASFKFRFVNGFTPNGTVAQIKLDKITAGAVSLSRDANLTVNAKTDKPVWNISFPTATGGNTNIAKETTGTLPVAGAVFRPVLNTTSTGDGMIYPKVQTMTLTPSVTNSGIVLPAVQTAVTTDGLTYELRNASGSKVGSVVIPASENATTAVRVVNPGTASWSLEIVRTYKDGKEENIEALAPVVTIDDNAISLTGLNANSFAGYFRMAVATSIQPVNGATVQSASGTTSAQVQYYKPANTYADLTTWGGRVSKSMLPWYYVPDATDENAQLGIQTPGSFKRDFVTTTDVKDNKNIGDKYADRIWFSINGLNNKPNMIVDTASFSEIPGNGQNGTFDSSRMYPIGFYVGEYANATGSNMVVTYGGTIVYDRNAGGGVAAYVEEVSSGYFVLKNPAENKALVITYTNLPSDFYATTAPRVLFRVNPSYTTQQDPLAAETFTNQATFTAAGNNGAEDLTYDSNAVNKNPTAKINYYKELAYGVGGTKDFKNLTRQDLGFSGNDLKEAGANEELLYTVEFGPGQNNVNAPFVDDFLVRDIVASGLQNPGAGFKIDVTIYRSNGSTAQLSGATPTSGNPASAGSTLTYKGIGEGNGFSSSGSGQVQSSHPGPADNSSNEKYDPANVIYYFELAFQGRLLKGDKVVITYKMTTSENLTEDDKIANYIEYWAYPLGSGNPPWIGLPGNGPSEAKGPATYGDTKIWSVATTPGLAEGTTALVVGDTFDLYVRGGLPNTNPKADAVQTSVLLLQLPTANANTFKYTGVSGVSLYTLTYNGDSKLVETGRDTAATVDPGDYQLEYLDANGAVVSDINTAAFVRLTYNKVLPTNYVLEFHVSAEVIGFTAGQNANNAASAWFAIGEERLGINNKTNTNSSGSVLSTRREVSTGTNANIYKAMGFPGSKYYAITQNTTLTVYSQPARLYMTKTGAADGTGNSFTGSITSDTLLRTGDKLSFTVEMTNYETSAGYVSMLYNVVDMSPRGMKIDESTITVTAGGAKLTKNVDYTLTLETLTSGPYKGCQRLVVTLKGTPGYRLQPRATLSVTYKALVGDLSDIPSTEFANGVAESQNSASTFLNPKYNQLFIPQNNTAYEVTDAEDVNTDWWNFNGAAAMLGNKRVQVDMDFKFATENVQPGIVKVPTNAGNPTNGAYTVVIPEVWPTGGVVIDWRITVNNEAGAYNNIENTPVIDLVPNNLEYVPGSAKIGSTPVEPKIENTANGVVLIWTIPELKPNQSVEITYKTTVKQNRFDTTTNIAYMIPDKLFYKEDVKKGEYVDGRQVLTDLRQFGLGDMAGNAVRAASTIKFVDAIGASWNLEVVNARGESSSTAAGRTVDVRRGESFTYNYTVNNETNDSGFKDFEVYVSYPRVGDYYMLLGVERSTKWNPTPTAGATWSSNLGASSVVIEYTWDARGTVDNTRDTWDAMTWDTSFTAGSGAPTAFRIRFVDGNMAKGQSVTVSWVMDTPANLDYSALDLIAYESAMFSMKTRGGNKYMSAEAERVGTRLAGRDDLVLNVTKNFTDTSYYPPTMPTKPARTFEFKLFNITSTGTVEQVNLKAYRSSIEGLNGTSVTVNSEGNLVMQNVPANGSGSVSIKDLPEGKYYFEEVMSSDPNEAGRYTVRYNSTSATTPSNTAKNHAIWLYEDPATVPVQPEFTVANTRVDANDFTINHLTTLTDYNTDPPRIAAKFALMKYNDIAQAWDFVNLNTAGEVTVTSGGKDIALNADGSYTIGVSPHEQSLVTIKGLGPGQYAIQQMGTISGNYRVGYGNNGWSQDFSTSSVYVYDKTLPVPTAIVRITRALVPEEPGTSSSTSSSTITPSGSSSRSTGSSSSSSTIVPGSGSSTSTAGLTSGSSSSAGGVVSISDPETPFFGGGNHWALVNLLTWVLGAVTAVIVVIRKFFFSSKQDEQEYEDAYAPAGANAQDQQEEPEKRKTGRVWAISSLVMAIVMAVVFFITEDMRLPMAIVDQWTLLMLALGIVEVVTVLLSARKSEEEEEEDYGVQEQY